MAETLTPKQAIFYGEYIKDENGTRAAIAAGYPAKSAHVAAARLLKIDKVSAAIEAWKQRQQEKLELSAERVLQELKKLAMFDAGNLYDSAGNRIPVHKLDDVTRAAVASVEDETTETTAGDVKTVRRNQRVKMADKIRAAELLGRYFKLFTDRVEHDGRVTLERLVSGERDAAA